MCICKLVIGDAIMLYDAKVKFDLWESYYELITRKKGRPVRRNNASMCNCYFVTWPHPHLKLIVLSLCVELISCTQFKNDYILKFTRKSRQINPI